MPKKLSCKNCERRRICKATDNLLAELSMATIAEPGFYISDALEAAAQVHYIMERIAEAAGDKANHAGFGPEPPAEVMDLLRVLKMVTGRKGEGPAVTLTEEVPHGETIH